VGSVRLLAGPTPTCQVRSGHYSLLRGHQIGHVLSDPPHMVPFFPCFSFCFSKKKVIYMFCLVFVAGRKQGRKKRKIPFCMLFKTDRVYLNAAILVTCLLLHSNIAHVYTCEASFPIQLTRLHIQLTRLL
jgi:hypothetical protein